MGGRREHPVDPPAARRLPRSSREEVDAFWQAGIDAGYRERRRARAAHEVRHDYYGGFLLDPDGNSVEAVYTARTPCPAGASTTCGSASATPGLRRFYMTIAPAPGFRLVRTSQPAASQLRGHGICFSLIPRRAAHGARSPRVPREDHATVDARSTTPRSPAG